MKAMQTGSAKVLLFNCTRQNPANFPGLFSVILGGNPVIITVPCSGRVGVGELMHALASGYDKVAVLSCGDNSCVHEFGCPAAKKAMIRARELAKVAGVDYEKLIFLEVDDLYTERSRKEDNVI